MGSVISQSVAGAGIEIDLDAGCRITSFVVGDHELLVTAAPDPIDWGWYPMAPFAGRVRDGRFSFRGTAYQLPRTLGEHAIHGSVFRRRWEAERDSVFMTDLGGEWPFSGWVRQEVTLGPDRLDLRLAVHSENHAMPASCGWHPWFRRSIGGAEAVLDLRAGFIFRRDSAGIATRARVPVPEGPWDDCFGEVEVGPTIRWPGRLDLSLESTCPYWVVFTERSDALCVEPQTAPPDSLNRDPFIVEPGRPLVAECTVTWSRPGSLVR